MASKTFKRLPYGNSNFESVWTENCAYVDKKRFIKMLEEDSNKNLFLVKILRLVKTVMRSLIPTFRELILLTK